MSRRRLVAAAVVGVLSIPAGATAVPAASPAQEDPSETESGHDDAAEHATVEIDVEVAEASPSTVSGALEDIQANVATQLTLLTAAETAVTDAINVLSGKASAVSETQLRVEDLTRRMDEVVVAAFVSPPTMDALEVLDSTSASDATMRQTMLDLQADEDADVLAAHEEARSELEDQIAEQEAAAADAQAARDDAEAALADLRAAVDQQTQFVLEVQARLADPASAANPALQGQADALAAQLQEIADAETAREAAAALAQAQAEAQARAEAEARAPAGAGQIICPVDGGGLHFTDTWGAARSGGRAHQGTDMLAARGTPTPAPVSGQVVHKSSSLGGYSWYLHGDDGDTYYGAHLSGYENQGAGWVAAGTVIGYVGDSGNATGTNHLHFEHQPGGGSSVNPYALLDASCPPH